MESESNSYRRTWKVEWMAELEIMEKKQIKRFSNLKGYCKSMLLGSVVHVVVTP